MRPQELIDALQSTAAPVVLDVRSRAEFVRGHVPGAIHMPFWRIVSRTARVPYPFDAPIVVYCGHGPRAHIAGAALRRRGFRDVRYLEGHMSHWARAGFPQARGTAPG
jgi:rhodanese-related sulfurtransferase